MIPTEVRIFVCTEPIDMRLGFDRLAAAVRDRVGQDPLSGGLYIFANRSATRLKLLWWDRNGLCILYKRLHRAVFAVPVAPAGARAVLLHRAALAALLAGSERPRPLRRQRNQTLH